MLMLPLLICHAAPLRRHADDAVAFAATCDMLLMLLCYATSAVYAALDDAERHTRAMPQDTRHATYYTPRCYYALLPPRNTPFHDKSSMFSHVHATLLSPVTADACFHYRLIISPRCLRHAILMLSRLLRLMPLPPAAAIIF